MSSNQLNPVGGADTAGPTTTAEPVGARLTRFWARTYTHRLPTDVALARRDEIAADLHDQLADVTVVSPTAVSWSIATRMLLGVPADLSWRSEQSRADRSARRKELAMSTSPTRSRNVALVLGVVIVGWGSIMTAGSAVEQVRAGGSQVIVWVMFAAAAVVGVVGLVLLARGRVVGAALLAVAALGTTAPFYWMPPIAVAGVASAAFFVAFTMRRRSIAASPLVPPVA